jgi:guanylate kinase
MSIVFIISAPSGSGKSTLVKGLLREVGGLAFSISHTTRPLRGQEQPGQNYYYISRSEFEQRAAQGEFLEHAEVFGNYYGTHRSELEKAEAGGLDLVLDIDVQGARQLKRRIPGAVSIFVLAPSRKILEQRLRDRSEDPEPVIQRRLREAAEEIRNYTAYDYVVVNRELDQAVDTLASIVRAERARRSRREEEIGPILATFE